MLYERLKRHESMYGPHFTESCALKAVSRMDNEDGTHGAHWSIDDAVKLATQYGIKLDTSKFNEYDWFVALNMVYSDFYKAVVNMTSTDHTKYFVELTKAWLGDKDVEAGKMWHYFKYVMCDMEDEEEEYYEDYDDDEYEDSYRTTFRRHRPEMRRIRSRY